jgi:Rrf2 family transcriptional repressor of oqxAB
MARGRFAVAVHALVILATTPETITSAFLAGSVNTDASCLRRMMIMLARAGLVDATEGREGGYRLARPPDEITLADIYHAVSAEPVLRPNPAAANPRCPISVAMVPAFAEIAADAESRFQEALVRRTLADLASHLELAARYPAPA